MDFARQYPKIAAGLGLSPEGAQDPHVERMIESFALLTARVHKRLDDDFPLFTESLLEVLYPHYLRPFPACAIAQFDPGLAGTQRAQPLVVPRGTPWLSRPVQGVSCRFCSSQDVTLWPVTVVAVQYRPVLVAPAGTRLPPQASSVLSITLEASAVQADLGALAGERLRFFLDGEPSQVSVWRDALCHKAVVVMVQTEPDQPWRGDPDGDGGGGASVSRPSLCGFDKDEALVDTDERSHPGYRLLTEYFAFPEKFNFVDVPVPRAVEGTTARSLTLQVLMAGIPPDADESRRLEAMNSGALRLGCTPVVNLFAQAADPIRITHTATAYPVLVDGRRPHAYEVHAIDRVFRVQQTAQGEQVQAFLPFFSLAHGDATDPTQAAPTRYWASHRDEDVARHSPGHELTISLVDLDFDPALPQTQTLSLSVRATNRDLPAALPWGAPGGDLFMEGGGVVREVRLLRKPTLSLRRARGRGLLWRLISHLSLNHLSFSACGIDGLREMLRLYDLTHSAGNRRQIDGLVAIAFAPVTAWLPGEPFATLVRGTQVRLTVDEDSHVGTGLSLFAAMLDRFFGLFVHINSFTQLTLVSARTQEELLACPPRSGDMPLL